MSTKKVAATEVTKRFSPDSRASRIASLEVSESFSEAKRIDLGTAPKEEILTTVAYIKSTLKSTLSKAADRATKRSGFKFVTEVGDFRTRSGDLVIVAVVTRLD